jgi:hypothetical protein
LRESIEAHLTVVFGAMAVSHYIEHQTGWSIKKFVRTARRYRTVEIKAGRQTLTAADPLSNDLRDVIAKISGQLEH